MSGMFKKILNSMENYGEKIIEQEKHNEIKLFKEGKRKDKNAPLSDNEKEYLKEKFKDHDKVTTAFDRLKVKEDKEKELALSKEEASKYASIKEEFFIDNVLEMKKEVVSVPDFEIALFNDEDGSDYRIEELVYFHNCTKDVVDGMDGIRASAKFENGPVSATYFFVESSNACHITSRYLHLQYVTEHNSTPSTCYLKLLNY